MQELNAIIVDDEEFARSSLYFLLQENCPNVDIRGIAKSVSEARTLLKNEIVNLIFLDIAMPGENGFSLIEQVQQTNATVIFTTAYDQYALRAIKANALDYLLKPIDIDELVAAVEKAREYHQKSSDAITYRNDSLKNLATDLQEPKSIKRITLPTSQGHRLVDVGDILHVEADSNYSIFHLNTKEQIIVSKVLKDYEEILPDDQFLRVHKSSIVNLKYIQEYHNRNGLTLLLRNGDSIPVSRRRASDFVERIKHYTKLNSEK